ncbi:effector-associated constant component EACC1 [Streptomyces sp. NPDC001880]
MEIAITVRDDGGQVVTDDLRGWLGRQRELRGRIQRGSAAARPTLDTMGAEAELITLLLAPGGVATVLAAAVVAWVQNRSGSQTVTITRADGTEVTVTSDRVKGLTAQQTSELAQQIAGSLMPQAQQTDGAADANPPAVRSADAPGTGTRPATGSSVSDG